MYPGRHLRQGSRGPHVVSKAVVVATGVAQSGDREVLGLGVGDSESGAFWTACLRSLRARGLGGVRLVIIRCPRGPQGRHRLGDAGRRLAKMPKQVGEWLSKH
jgi:putative transposase